jgi:hypothetical protein
MKHRGARSVDPEQIRLRIRHFLLQQSTIFRQSIAKNSSLPPVLAIARELSRRIDMPPRRLQKYLARELGPKEIAITLNDLALIAGLKNLPLSEFLAYLLDEKAPPELTGWKKNAISFVQSLHEGHRRALDATLFSEKDHPRSERLIELIIQLYALNDQDISTIESIAEAFNLRKNQGKK